jgi:hypothetical protein
MEPGRGGLDAAVGELVAELAAALGVQLVSLTVYGSHASSEPPHPRDPIRLCVELDPCDATGLRTAGRVLGAPLRAARFRPYFVARGELGRLSDVFPLRIHGILASHRVVYGPDPLATVRVSPEHLRIGVEQGLRNHLVRLRAHVALRGADDAASQATLLAVAEGIEDEASALGALGAVSGTGPLPGDVVDRLRQVRDGLPADEALLVDVLDWLSRTADEVDSLEGAPPRPVAD